MADSELPLGRKEYLPGTWVQFKTRGYPFGLRKKWDELRDDRETLTIILSHIEAWQVTDVAGQPIELGPDPVCLDNAEDAFIVWLIGAFYRFWRVELPLPPKNSLPPSANTSTPTA